MGSGRGLGLKALGPITHTHLTYGSEGTQLCAGRHVVKTRSRSMMQGVLVTCCCLLLLQSSPKQQRHPKVYNLKQGGSESARLPSLCCFIVPQCATTNRNQARRVRAWSHLAAPCDSSFSIRNLSSLLCKIITSASLQLKKIKTRHQNKRRKWAPDGHGHS